jgi:hypothetical protein
MKKLKVSLYSMKHFRRRRKFPEWLQELEGKTEVTELSEDIGTEGHHKYKLNMKWVKSY